MSGPPPPACRVGVEHAAPDEGSRRLVLGELPATATRSAVSGGRTRTVRSPSRTGSASRRGATASASTSGSTANTPAASISTSESVPQRPQVVTAETAGAEGPDPDGEEHRVERTDRQAFRRHPEAGSTAATTAAARPGRRRRTPPLPYPEHGAVVQDDRDGGPAHRVSRSG